MVLSIEAEAVVLPTICLSASGQNGQSTRADMTRIQMQFACGSFPDVLVKEREHNGGAEVHMIGAVTGKC